MPDATLKDFTQLVMEMHLGMRPIMPKPKWGQDAAYLGFMIDRLYGVIDQYQEALNKCYAEALAGINLDEQRGTISYGNLVHIKRIVDTVFEEDE
jgi:hypothetical protein